MKRLLISLLALVLLVAPLSVLAQDGDTASVEVFVTDDGAFLTVLPPGWAADGDRFDGLTIANDPAILEAMDADLGDGPASGQFAMLVLALPLGDVEMMLGEDAELDAILELIISFMSGDEDTPEFGEISELVDEDLEFEGVVAYGANEKFDAMITAYELAPFTYGIAVLMAAPGELEDWEETGLTLVTLTSYAPELDADYTTADGLSFSYPSDWLVVEQEGIVTITSEELDMESEDVLLESGQFAVSLVNLSALGISDMALEDVAELLLDELLEEGDEANDPLILIIDGDEILLVSVENETENEGGFILHDHDGTIYAAIYVGANGESGLVGYLAASMLLSIE